MKYSKYLSILLPLLIVVLLTLTILEYRQRHKREPSIKQNGTFVQQENDQIREELLEEIIENGACFESAGGLIEANSFLTDYLSPIERQPYLTYKSGLIYFRYLRQGSRGMDVKAINTGLNLLGYSTDEKSILYSIKTKQAIMSFQKSNQLMMDGVVGEKTVNMLNQALLNQNIQMPKVAIQIETPPSRSYWLTINKSSNVLTLYRHTQVLKRYAVATGRKPELTPKGKYVIANKIIKPHWGGNGNADPVEGGIENNPLGSRWMGISWGNGTKYGIHGNNNPASVGLYVSSGCIRMYNSDVEELFSLIPKNTPVLIGTMDQLVTWLSQ